MTKPIAKKYAINYCMSFKELKVTSWPQVISKLLVAPACLHVASDWPHTIKFFTPKVFLFSYIIREYYNIRMKVHTYNGLGFNLLTKHCMYRLDHII